MSARHVNPDQLKLVMTASEYKAHIDSSSDRSYRTVGHEEVSPNVRMPIQARETMDEMWSRKEAEAKSPATVPITDVQWRNGRGVRTVIGEQRSPVHGAGVYDSIKENGLRQDGGRSPIMAFVDTATGEKRQGEGHHRVAAAAAIERETGKAQWIRPTYTPANLPKMNG